MKFDPEKHHRRSIRLKSHDYAGGGEYFVTICAHRDWVAQEKGAPFHLPGMREIIAAAWAESVGAGLVPAPYKAAHEEGTHEEGTHEEVRHEACPYAIMPDHFHGVVVLPPGPALGDVIGAFKSRVVHAVVQGVKRGKFPPFPGKIWHRNYYEKIVRSEKERASIAKYIALNPVRLIFAGTHKGCPYRAFGNPALLELKKAGVLASGPAEKTIQGVPELNPGWAWVSGFHSAQEEQVFRQSDAPCIMIPAVRAESVGLTSAQMDRLNAGELLVLCPFEEVRTTRANALARNRLIAGWCERLWIPAVRPGGALEKLEQEFAARLIRPRFRL